MNLISCTTSTEAKTRAGEALRAFLMETKKQSQPVLLLLSGGSAFSFLDAIHEDVLGEHVTIGMLDERFSRDESVHNFMQLTKTAFYAEALAAGALYIDTRIMEHETQEALAARFEKALRNWQKTHKNSIIIATMGVGTDGHTAGIMPFPENEHLFRQLFENKNKWVVAYNAGDKNIYPLRVTITMPFLRTHIDHAIVYVVGEEKKPALEQVCAKTGLLTETPARVFHEMRDIHFFYSILTK